MFLCNATRFKLSFGTSGNVSCLQPYAKELEGRWVALVPADDDKHIVMAAERDRLKAANAELTDVVEMYVAFADKCIQDPLMQHITWAARAALTKHQGATT